MSGANVRAEITLAATTYDEKTDMKFLKTNNQHVRFQQMVGVDDGVYMKLTANENVVDAQAAVDAPSIVIHFAKKDLIKLLRFLTDDYYMEGA